MNARSATFHLRLSPSPVLEPRAKKQKVLAENPVQVAEASFQRGDCVKYIGLIVRGSVKPGDKGTVESCSSSGKVAVRFGRIVDFIESNCVEKVLDTVTSQQLGAEDVNSEAAEQRSPDAGAAVADAGSEDADVDVAMEEPGFSLTAIKSLAGERKQIEGLHPNTLVSELMQRVREAFGYGDCRHTFNACAKFCIGKETLTEPSRTLQELNVSPETLVDFVLTKELLTLKVSDGTLRVMPDVAFMCAKIKAAVDEQGSDKVVDMSGESCKMRPLTHVLEYCAYHRHEPEPVLRKPLASTDLMQCGASAWDADFVTMPQEQLFEIILVANHLDMKGLLDLSCGKIAAMIKGKSTEEIRKQFNIVNDFTPEEEAQVREENRWCEDA